MITYQIRLEHQLTERGFERSLDFASRFICRCQYNRFLTNVVTGDKAHFSMKGTVKTFLIFK